MQSHQISSRVPRAFTSSAVRVALVIAAAVGCSNTPASTGGAGGKPASTGGSPTTGGTVGTGGSQGTGGSSASGGSSGTGGAGTGGNLASGGTPSAGGTPGRGGATGTGGATSSGGTSGRGGATGTGGVTSAGGAQVTGGVTGAGGMAGATGAGGTQAAGGVTSAGGAQVTGGTTGAGGVTGAGGTRPDGGGADGAADAGDAGDVGAAWNPCPTTAGTACKVLPLGDSITEGCCVAPMGGYRIELFRQAVTNKKAITFVGSLTNGPTTVSNQSFPQHHEGHGGYTINTDSSHNGISGQITDNALANYSPHIVLLMIGTNDINGNVDQPNAPTRLGALMDDILTRAPNALLVVSSIIPAQNDGTTANFQKYNAAIPGLVDTRAKAGKHVVFIDNFKAFSANTSYKTALMYDGLHPNDAGYVVLGQSWYGVIGGFLPPSQ